MSFDLRILRDPATGLVIDLGPSTGEDAPHLGPALAAMTALEAGSMANHDEGRQVGHYWLRAPSRAPSEDMGAEIRAVVDRILNLKVPHCDTVLMLGVGGSALGPELAIDALRPKGTRRFLLIDTVDPAGIERVLDEVEPRTTIVLVASKSGGTVETRQALRMVEAAYAQDGVCFADHAIAITGPGSGLDQDSQGWLDRFPVWDWVGGRTSITSAVGLVPMHLCGIDIEQFLAGAREMDAWTRQPLANNPAAQMAALWHTCGRPNLATIPYCDRLRHLGRYLQQLIMESLGKAEDRNGKTIHHGLTVFGNKGSADQHAIVQQLRDGPDDVMIHLIDCAAAPSDSPLTMDAADLQFALLRGTREALIAVNRPVISITTPDMGPKSLGSLIALFERAVGLAAELANINAYNQPGVEAGKTAAKLQLAQLREVENCLGSTPLRAQDIADKLNIALETAWRLATHLSHSGRAALNPGKSPSEDRFQATK